jgi:hypothetical protein
MGARQVVLLIPSKSSHPRTLLSRQQTTPVSSLAATLMDFAVSVANKRLTEWLSPLDATLRKSGGWGASPFDVSSFRPCHVQTFRRVLDLSPFLSCSCALFGPMDAQQLLWNQFVPHSFRRNGGVPPLSSPQCLFRAFLHPYFRASFLPSITIAALPPGGRNEL